VEVLFPDGKTRFFTHHEWRVTNTVNQSTQRNHLSVSSTTRPAETSSDSHRQIRSASFPPKCLPIRHGLPVNFERRGGMEARHHHQRNPAWYSVSARRTEPRITSASRGIQSFQERSSCVREEDQTGCQRQSCTLMIQTFAHQRHGSRADSRRRSHGYSRE